MSDKISKGVMKTNEWGNLVMYRAMCSCGDTDHDITISFEYDKECNEMELFFYKKIDWCTNWSDPWYKNAWRRIRDSLKMLFTGWIELEADFLIQDIDHIDNIITAMIDGRVLMRRKIEKERMKEEELKKKKAIDKAIDRINEMSDEDFNKEIERHKQNEKTMEFPETKEELNEEVKEGF